MTLPGLKYLQMNCISECRHRHVMKYCECKIDALFPENEFVTNNSCNFKSLKCLLDYNGEDLLEDLSFHEVLSLSDVFNYEKPPNGNPFFNDEDEGMTCPCLPECNRVDYALEISPNIVS